MIWIGSTLTVAAIAMLRYAWGQPKRSAKLNAAAWALLAAALTLAAEASGAWGVAIAALAGTGTAFVMLAWAALTAPRGRAKPLERSVHLLDSGAPLDIGRRLLTFLITVPLALIVSFELGLAARTLAEEAGWGDADGNVLMLLAMPLAWAVLMVALLMTARRRTQAALLLAPAVASGTVLLIGLRA